MCSGLVWLGWTVCCVRVSVFVCLCESEWNFFCFAYPETPEPIFHPYASSLSIRKALCTITTMTHMFLRTRRHSTIFNAIMFIYSWTWKSNKAFETSKLHPFVVHCLSSHATNVASSRNTFHAINTCRIWLGAPQPRCVSGFDLSLSHRHTMHVFIDYSTNY